MYVGKSTLYYEGILPFNAPDKTLTEEIGIDELSFSY